LAEVMERARVRRLTRNQHILFRLGELIAHAECSASLARRAANAAQGSLNPKAETRFDATALAAMSRICARDAAIKVAEMGMRWASDSEGASDADITDFTNKLQLPAIHRAQAGLMSDMDYVADVLYDRTSA
jgi:alkylation response protein AidB-like acyl-CoA dehydrogenase